MLKMDQAKITLAQDVHNRYNLAERPSPQKKLEDMPCSYS